MTDNISRFPYSGFDRRDQTLVELTDAEVAAMRAGYLARLPGMLVEANAAVAAETSRIIAAMRERRGRQTVAMCREDALRVTMQAGHAAGAKEEA